jgi:hypothetical protein
LLHPGLAKVYALKVSNLHEALDDPSSAAERVNEFETVAF